jgi:polar amino acid transport system permease protein
VSNGVTQATRAGRHHDDDLLPVVRVRHPEWWIGSVVLLVLALMFGHLLLTNPNLGWSTVGEYLLSEPVLAGLWRTVWLTALTMVLGVVLGTVTAVMRLSANPAFRLTSGAFVWFFRGVPPLVQLIFWYNLASLVPRLSVGVPFGPELLSGDTNGLISPYTAAIIGLTLIEGAYACEIIRAGILSVPKGQLDAASSLGMSPLLTLRRVVLPQAMRVIIPPIGNDTISMLKTTTLVSVLGLPELLYSAQLIYARNYQVIPLLVTATIWYLVLTSLLSIGQRSVERRFSRGYGRPSEGRAPTARAPRIRRGRPTTAASGTGGRR